MCDCSECSKLPMAPGLPGKHINPATGIFPIHEWGNECARGWVRDDRFGTGQVIKGTNRNKTRQVYRAKGQ